MHRLQWQIAVLTLVVVTSLGAVRAQTTVQARVDALVTFSEKDNQAALAAMKTLGESLGPTTAYPERRHYLDALVSMQVDAAQVDAAQASVTELREWATRYQDEVGRLQAETHAAELLTLSGQTSAAATQLEALAPRVTATHNANVQWHFYRALGNAQLTLGRFEAALDSTFKAMPLAKEISPLAQLRTLNFLATVYMAMTNWDKALQVLNDALVLAQGDGSTKIQGTLYLNQGAVLTSLGQVARAQDAYQKALAIGRETGTVGLQATALNNLGDGYLIAKQYSKAEVFARQAMEKYRAAGEAGGLAVARSNLGFALMGQGRMAEGAAEVRAALQAVRSAGAKADQEGILGELSRMYEQAGLYREAVTTIREQQELSAQLFRAEREKTVAAMQEQFDTVQRQKQIELLARENSLKDAEIANRRLQQLVTLLAAVLTVAAGGFVYQLYLRVRKTNAKLREVNQQLEFHAVRDPLTGLYNRRSFFDLMQKRPALKAGDRRDDNQPDGLMILDIDHFKHINDTLGHAGGDAVLVEIAKRLRATMRESDLVMRWGGEEFLIFSPKASVEHLQILAQRVLKAIGATPIEVAGAPLTVTATGGFLTLPFSGLPESVCNWEKAILIADMALYLGKVNGRNRAYGLGRLLVPFEQAMPVLERDLSAALKAQMVELHEVQGPATPG